MRSVMAFLTGFIAGMLFLLLMLWSHGSLLPVRAAGPAAGQTVDPLSAVARQAMADEVPSLIVPVQGVNPSEVSDTFADSRGGRGHEATDIMAPRGTPVLAVDDGVVEKLFESKRGGTTIYQFDPTRTWCYYYAHLDHYAAGIVQGMAVRKGMVIGYVGSTGNASPTAPHLHFAIFKLGPEKHWWHGTAVDPYPALMRHARQ